MELKLDLGCGQNPKEGFDGVDLYAPNAKYKVDLFKFPYPFEDNSVDEIHCSHFVEHLPCREVEARDIAVDLLEATRFRNQDFFFAFFDECYRVLKPEGTMFVAVPFGRNTRAFQDPTHRRFIMAETFGYLWKPWREANRLDHYNVRCNFASDVRPIVMEEMNLLAPERAAHKMNVEWNAVLDLHVTLKPVK